MAIKIFLFLLSFVLIQNSEAQLRCFDLFAGNESYAQVIDQLNAKFNKNIFSTDLQSVLSPQVYDPSILEDFKIQNQKFRLKKALKQLKNADEWTRYDFEKFSKKLLKLSFLLNDSFLKDIPSEQRLLFIEARHAALARGLEDFFFHDAPATPKSIRQKVFSWLVEALRPVYWRWALVLVKVPKLDGVVMTPEDAALILWQGTENRQDLIEKYDLVNLKEKLLSLDASSLSFSKWKDVTKSIPEMSLVDWKNSATSASRSLRSVIFLNSIKGKYYFNSLGTLWNYSVLTMTLATIPIYGTISFIELKESGEIKAAQFYEPLIHATQAAAQVDQHQLNIEKDMQDFSEKVWKIKHRMPTSNELKKYRQMLEEKYAR